MQSAHEIDLGTTLPSAVTFFSESPSRISLVSMRPDLAELERLPARTIRHLRLSDALAGTALSIWANGGELIALEVAELETAWRTALSRS